MRVRVGRVACAAACICRLAGCEIHIHAEPVRQALRQHLRVQIRRRRHHRLDRQAVSRETSGPFSSLAGPPKLTPELLGTDPNDDLAIGKKYYRQGSYGLAERHFRKAVELHPRDAGSWVGLAAAYDQLRRFDLADRAYAQVISLIGETPEVMNNLGFSYMLRSDYRRARATLLAARAKAPDNPHIAAEPENARSGRAQDQGRQLNSVHLACP